MISDDAQLCKLGLPAHGVNALRNIGVLTVGDVRRYGLTRHELARIPNLGAKSAKDIAERLGLPDSKRGECREWVDIAGAGFPKITPRNE